MFSPEALDDKRQPFSAVEMTQCLLHKHEGFGLTLKTRVKSQAW